MALRVPGWVIIGLGKWERLGGYGGGGPSQNEVGENAQVSFWEEAQSAGGPIHGLCHPVARALAAPVTVHDTHPAPCPDACRSMTPRQSMTRDLS